MTAPAKEVLDGTARCDLCVFYTEESVQRDNYGECRFPPPRWMVPRHEYHDDFVLDTAEVPSVYWCGKFFPRPTP